MKWLPTKCNDTPQSEIMVTFNGVRVPDPKRSE